MPVTSPSKREHTHSSRHHSSHLPFSTERHQPQTAISQQWGWPPKSGSVLSFLLSYTPSACAVCPWKPQDPIGCTHELDKKKNKTVVKSSLTPRPPLVFRRIKDKQTRIKLNLPSSPTSRQQELLRHETCYLVPSGLQLEGNFRGAGSAGGGGGGGRGAQSAQFLYSKGSSPVSLRRHVRTSASVTA